MSYPIYTMAFPALQQIGRETCSFGQRKLPGYISNNFHKSLNGTKVTIYAQWRSQADFEAMLHSPETALQFQAHSKLVTSFEPHLNEVAFVDEAVAE